jgi:Ca-activated chloride channel family protein
LSVELDPGFALASLYSPSHRIAIEAIDPFVQLVTLAEDTVPADRDFELVWTPALGATPEATLLAEQHDDEIYALLTVLPPDLHAPSGRMARETIFVVDTSGSMAGDSIEQAKLALLIALDQLQTNDRFNVIQFNSLTEQLFADSVPADDEHLERARDYVGALVPRGGTEMQPALEAALAGAAPAGILRQVVFMTDGAVGNEEALLGSIAANLGNSRLFTVGIGSAPNAFFMRKAAQFGRGTFTYVGSPQEVSARMDELFHKLERPVLADVAVDWMDGDEETWPNPIPDLYAGEPIVVAVRLRELPDTVTVSGRIGAAPWRVVLHRPPLDSSDGGIRQLWARRKIDALMDSAAAGADRDAMRAAVVELALEHHLVSSYTSLVAVDVTPTAPSGMSLLTHEVPVNAPHGTALALPRTATPAPLYALLATAFALLAIGGLVTTSGFRVTAAPVTAPHRRIVPRSGRTCGGPPPTFVASTRSRLGGA